jgi:hypothetical protein
MKLRHFVSKGKIKDGKLVLDNPRWFRTCLLKYDDTDKLRITIEKERGTRSKKQNAYYWSVVLAYIAEYMGEQPEDLHEIFKAKFLKRKRVWRGAEMTVLPSTTKLNSDEFGEYIERCVQEGAELGVVVPMADKNYDLIETTSTH